MDQYVTGGMIRRFREERGMTQAALAEKLMVSDKAVSKWETGRGYPDITLIEPLAKALGLSVAELLSGEEITNINRAGNMLRSHLYVCPICGNVLLAAGKAVISCCGLTLMPLEAETPDAGHLPQVTAIEDEYYVRLPHEMTREHHITFIAGLSDNGMQLTRLYPEGDAEAYVRARRTQWLYWYCNRHGLFRARVRDLVNR